VTVFPWRGGIAMIARTRSLPRALEDVEYRLEVSLAPEVRRCPIHERAQRLAVDLPAEELEKSRFVVRRPPADAAAVAISGQPTDRLRR
jgi:hypothetical protein